MAKNPGAFLTHFQWLALSLACISLFLSMLSASILGFSPNPYPMTNLRENIIKICFKMAILSGVLVLALFTMQALPEIFSSVLSLGFPRTDFGCRGLRCLYLS